MSDRLTLAVERGRQEGKLALYFGCWDRPGHYLHKPGGWSTLEPKRDFPGIPWGIGLMDGGLLHNGKRPDVYDGKVFSTCGGLSFWWAFYWWDRSGDRRGASNSGFYVRGFTLDEQEAALAYAGEQFPHVIARQKHPLILQPRRPTERPRPMIDSQEHSPSVESGADPDAFLDSVAKAILAVRAKGLSRSLWARRAAATALLMLEGHPSIRSLQAPVVAGWRMVPEEPTRAMWAASGDAVNKFGHRLKRHHDRYSDAVWTAMLAAAPLPPLLVGGEEENQELMAARASRKHDGDPSPIASGTQHDDGEG